MDGTAEHTTLDDASVDLVSCATSFHWFDAGAALAEFHRILKPGGHVAAIWNIRAESPFMADYEALLRRFSQEYATLERWEQLTAPSGAALLRAPRS